MTSLTGGLRYGGSPELRLKVKDGDTLDGTGHVNGGLKVDAGGTVYPGINGVGTLTVDPNGHFASGSIWKVKLGTAIADGSNTSNAIDFSGKLNIDGGMIMPIDGSGLTFTAGQTYDYIIATSEVRDFSIGAVTFQPTNFNPAEFATPGNFSLITSGSDLILRFTPVPEPGLALAVGALGLAGWAVRRRASLRRHAGRSARVPS